MIAIMRLPNEIDPKEYVVARLNAPIVAPFGIPPGLPVVKSQLLSIA